jgi:hypothetical protein
MKKTIKKVKNYNFGKGVVRDTYFVNVWDEYGDLVKSVGFYFSKADAELAKKNIFI